MVRLSFLGFLSLPIVLAVNLGVIIPLALSCLVVGVVIPSAAWRGRMSVPFYALMLFAASFVAYGVGKVAGVQSVHGTALGIVISFIFFLLVAAAVGSFLGIFFYRQPTGESSANAPEPSVPSAVPALDKDRQ